MVMIFLSGFPRDCLRNEHWTECALGAACQMNCPKVLGEEPIPLCLPAEPCPGGCVCDDGYVRTSNTDLNCIPREQCGKEKYSYNVYTYSALYGSFSSQSVAI